MRCYLPSLFSLISCGVHWVLAAVTLVASFVAGLSGFGFGLIAMAIVPLFIGIKVAGPFVSVCSFLIFTVLVVPVRRDINWKFLIPLLVGSAAGVPVGVYGLAVLDNAVLLRIMGVFLLLYVAFALTLQPRLRTRLDRRWGYAAGLLGGAIAGALSTGGPPVAVYFTAVDLDKSRFKATMMAYLVLMIGYKIALFYASGLLGAEVWRTVLYYLLPVALGTTAGMLAFRWIRERWFRLVVLLLLLGSAVAMLVKA